MDVCTHVLQQITIEWISVGDDCCREKYSCVDDAPAFRRRKKQSPTSRSIVEKPKAGASWRTVGDNDAPAFVCNALYKGSA